MPDVQQQGSSHRFLTIEYNFTIVSLMTNVLLSWTLNSKTINL